MTDDRVPVLIVGGGLAGLSAALFLGQHGVRTLLVERHRTTSIHPRARGFNARTMELFRGAGLADAIHAAGADLRRNHDILFYRTFAEPPLRRVPEPRDDEPTLRISPTTECMCPQDALEPILLTAAVAAGCTARFGTELVACQPDAHGVTATIEDRDTGDRRTVRADYLLACDGARGGLRERVGITRSGSAPTFHSINISLTADLADLTDNPFILAYATHPDGAGLLLPVNNRDRWVFQVRYHPERGQTPADFDPDRCVELIRTATGRPELAVRIDAVLPWETTALLADRFRAGRVFLVGDAAHVMPPAGAFGANTGIQDAHNLAWKLAYVLRGWAGPGLLDSYQAERRPVAAQTIEQALLRWQTWENHTEPGADPFADDLTVVFGQHYASTAVADGVAGPLRLALDGTPGTRVPHQWSTSDNTLSTVDLAGPDFVVARPGRQSGQCADILRAGAAD